MAHSAGKFEPMPSAHRLPGMHVTFKELFRSRSMPEWDLDRATDHC
jgi:hypothetical protein